LSTSLKVLALCGGVGGAKLALFEHLGLSISPDIDTISYTLAGVANPDTGWGRAGETWSFMESLAALGGDTWFRLGDKDLALNVLRTNMLQAGSSLSEVTAKIAKSLGISEKIIPMSDSQVRTTFDTDRGTLSFQDYFVRLQCQAVVSEIRFEGASDAQPSPQFSELLVDDSIDAIIVCPSNPFISIDPILAIPSVRNALASHPAPVIAVSPVIDGQSIKGPTSKLMAELDLGSSSADIATYYRDFVDGLLIDHRDSEFIAPINDMGIASHCSNILMSTFEDRCQLAQEAIDFARRLTL
jgi:LPPG:FO 2-phospho-L-lactate transferase